MTTLFSVCLFFFFTSPCGCLCHFYRGLLKGEMRGVAHNNIKPIQNYGMLISAGFSSSLSVYQAGGGTDIYLCIQQLPSKIFVSFASEGRR